MISLLQLNQNDLVVEIASNDGYLLQYFANSSIKVLGIEPASGVAKTAIAKGIPTLINYFGESTAVELTQGQKPKLMIGNNVLAHVPDIHDFIKGFSVLIADEGVITFEFPHLLNLIKNICRLIYTCISNLFFLLWFYFLMYWLSNHAVFFVLILILSV
jgi:2-polyprenyl-3-methyl-5-hydroxy-6-metoxy-1,4-benzoquinol methylase